MPHRSMPHHHQGDHHAHVADGQRQHSARQRRPNVAAGYTLGHAGRQVRLGPIAFWAVAAALALMAVWSAGTATYFAFRDDLLTRLISRQAEMQYAYEDRIAELRAQVDRLASRQLLDQEQYEQRLDQLVRRQTLLESRAGTLSTLPDMTPTGSIKQPPRPPVTGDRSTAIPPKPSPISDTVILVAPPDREARLESRPLPGAGPRVAAASGGGLDAALARLTASLDRIDASQMATLNAIEEGYDSKARRIRRVLADLGLEVDKTPARGPSSGIGGPFVPTRTREPAAFDRQLFRINAARVQVDRLSRTLVVVPIRKPVTGEIDTTSGFGMRLDPFLRSPAMHTGLDFRGDHGEPIRATAAGTITHAGWSGGYGRMVEIDHGNGLATRYGHLSAIDVEIGQTVRIGQVVGRLGSTGRSTGPHLHYETRIDGEAVDPQRFLRAGLRLGGLI